VRVRITEVPSLSGSLTKYSEPDWCQQLEAIVIFQILTATAMLMAAFWDVTQCSLIKLAYVSEVLNATIVRAIG
jgi:hypothetical protein